MNYPHSHWRDRLAAEYVLGTLRGAARRRFERLLPAHPTLQRAVADWEGRLNRLASASPPTSPPPEVWLALQRRLFSAEPPRSWWNSVAFWRGLAAAGMLAAVVALAPQLVAPPPEAAMAFAAIRGKQQEVLWTVARSDDGRLHVSNLRPMAMPPDQRCFLWLKAADSSPVMLGVLPDDGSARTLPMPSDVTEPTRSELWVTMQPIAPKPSPPTEPLYQTRWKAI
ncbi:MAG: anti-sigma factor [Candidatus Competibacteraceae bacterium]|nr:anti-sigma factor [Candidatus Competibacteraceae bacterium]